MSKVKFLFAIYVLLFTCSCKSELKVVNIMSKSPAGATLNYGRSPDRYLTEPDPIIVDNEFSIYKCFSCDAQEHQYFFLPTKLKFYNGLIFKNTKQELEIVLNSTVDYQSFWRAKELLKLYDLHGNLFPITTSFPRVKEDYPKEVLEYSLKKRVKYTIQIQPVQNFLNSFQTSFILKVRGRNATSAWKKYLESEKAAFINYELEVNFFAYDSVGKKVVRISKTIIISLSNLNL